jgi:hypothetical protein
MPARSSIIVIVCLKNILNSNHFRGNFFMSKNILEASIRHCNRDKNVCSFVCTKPLHLIDETLQKIILLFKQNFDQKGCRWQM